MKKLLIITFLVFGSFNLNAAPFAVGLSGGGEFPFAHSETDPGIAAEVFARMDPYEIRFRYADLDVDYYSVVMAVKHFFTDGLLRPFAEAAAGPAVIYSAGHGNAFGVTPQLSVGADMAINGNLSLGLTTRYSGYVYFGETTSGWFQANHSLAILGNVILWF